MFLRSAGMSRLWETTARGAGTVALAICAPLLLVSIAGCVVVAWLAAAALTLLWAVLVVPLSDSGGQIAD